MHMYRRNYGRNYRLVVSALFALTVNIATSFVHDRILTALASAVMGAVFVRRVGVRVLVSMGPATAEAPYINPTTTRPLEAGMILAFEVPCYIGGVQGFNIEDMVLITETGCEVLTPNTPHYL